MRTLQIAIILAISISCNNGEKVDGLWAIHNTDPDEHPILDRVFWEIKEGRIYSIRFGDPTTGDLASIFRDTLEFELEKNVIILGENGFIIDRQGDTVILTAQEEDLKGFTLFKLHGLTKKDLENFDCFRRSYNYHIPNQDDPLTLDFINDSVILFTVDHPEPAQRYDVTEINGIAMLNIHNSMHPIMTISTCSQAQLILKNPSQDLSVVLTPTSSDRKRNDLIGRWVEIPGEPKSSAPPGLSLADQYRIVQFREDSIIIQYMGHTSRSTWDVSGDGRRIYFIDRIFEPNGTWRILELSDSLLTMSLQGRDVLDNELIRLERVQ